MDWEAAFIIVTWAGIGGVWWHNQVQFRRKRMEDCSHENTTTFRMYGFPLSRHGAAVKKCQQCGKQWNLYHPGAEFPHYKEEYDIETRQREREYVARKREWERIHSKPEEPTVAG